MITVGIILLAKSLDNKICIFIGIASFIAGFIMLCVFTWGYPSGNMDVSEMQIINLNGLVLGAFELIIAGMICPAFAFFSTNEITDENYVSIEKIHYLK